MKKRLTFLLMFVLVLSLAGCSKTPGEILNSAFIKQATNESYQSKSNLTASMKYTEENETYKKELVLTSESKFKGDNFNTEFTGDFDGLKFGGKLFGNDDAVHFTSDTIDQYTDTDYITFDTKSYYESKGVDYEAIKEANKKVDKEFGEFIFLELGIENLLVVTEGEKEEITVNGDELKAQKYTATINHETTKENAEKILSYFIENNDIINITSTLYGDYYSEQSTDEFKDILAEIEGISDEEYAETYDKYKEYLEEINFEFYVYKKNIVKDRVSFKHTESEITFEVIIENEYFNFDKVEDFDASTPASTWDIFSITKVDLSSASSIIRTSLVKLYDIPESGEFLTSVDVAYDNGLSVIDGNLDIESKYIQGKFFTNLTASAMGISTEATIALDENHAVITSDLLPQITGGSNSVYLDIKEFKTLYGYDNNVMDMIKESGLSTEEIKEEVLNEIKYLITEESDWSEIENVKASMGLSLQLIKYIVYDFDINNIAELSQPTKETVSIGGVDTELTHVNGHITLMKYENLINHAVENLILNESFYDALYQLQYESNKEYYSNEELEDYYGEYKDYDTYKTYVKDEVQSMLEEADGYFQNDLQEVENILENIVFNVYVDNSGKSIKTVYDVKIDTSDESFDIKFSNELFNANNVEDFDVVVPQDAMNISDMEEELVYLEEMLESLVYGQLYNSHDYELDVYDEQSDEQVSLYKWVSEGGQILLFDNYSYVVSMGNSLSAYEEYEYIIDAEEQSIYIYTDNGTAFMYYEIEDNSLLIYSTDFWMFETLKDFEEEHIFFEGTLMVQ